MNWQKEDLLTLAPHLPGESLPWLQSLRDSQWQVFMEKGFPTRHNEAWKYTDLSAMTGTVREAGLKSFSQDFQQIPSNASLKQLAPNEGGHLIEISFLNGQVKAASDDLPAGLVVSDLRSALFTHPQQVRQALSEHQASQENMVNFNTSLWQNGVFILVPDDTEIDRPIFIRYHTVSIEPQVMVFRNIISLGKNAQLTVFQQFSSESDASYWQQSITQIDLNENAQLTQIKCQDEGVNATHLCENIVQQAAGSAYRSKSFSLGAKLHREAWHVNLLGQAAQSCCEGLNVLRLNQHSDYHVNMNHQAPACVSDQVFKAIATDKARSVFNGKVTVHADGQKAVANQLSQNLLLSSSAEIDTRPELEIYADDVKCSHGASVGQLDPDALFYLQSRGIAHDQAGEMLLHAFVHDQLNDLLLEIQEPITNLLNQKLAEINGEKAI